LLVSLLWLAFACENTVSTSLEGKKCDGAQRCASGYVCDASRDLCVRPDQLTGSAGGSDANSTRDGSPGCGAGEASCASGCAQHA
jgi:hypothetical protein